MVLNGSSVSWTVKVSNIVTVTKLSAIAIIIGCGIYQLSIGNRNHTMKTDCCNADCVTNTRIINISLSLFN